MGEMKRNRALSGETEKCRKANLRFSTSPLAQAALDWGGNVMTALLIFGYIGELYPLFGEDNLLNLELVYARISILRDGKVEHICIKSIRSSGV
jgi:hypothetical protein